MRKIIVLIFPLIFLSSCVLDEIVISMVPNGNEPVFYFKYLKASKRTVSLTDVSVYEAGTGRLVWEISTVDPSIDFIYVDGTPEGKRIPKNVRPTHYEVRFVRMSQITLGTVPDGFKQYVPGGNKKPILMANVEYILGAGGATGGRILFTIDGRCRRLPSTSFAHEHPLFRQESGCFPEIATENNRRQ